MLCCHHSHKAWCTWCGCHGTSVSSPTQQYRIPGKAKPDCTGLALLCHLRLSSRTSSIEPGCKEKWCLLFPWKCFNEFHSRWNLRVPWSLHPRAGESRGQSVQKKDFKTEGSQPAKAKQIAIRWQRLLETTTQLDSSFDMSSTGGVMCVRRSHSPTPVR